MNADSGWMDGHCHFSGLALPSEALKKMNALQVRGAVSCGADLASNEKALKQQKQFKNILAAVGLHPEAVLANSESENSRCADWIQKNVSSAVGIGEIGLDFKYADSSEKREKQQVWFERLLKIAFESEKPVLVHSRKAVDETIATLEKFRMKKVLIHWFDGTSEQLDRIQNNGWLVSVGPAVLNQKKIQKIAATIELNRLVLETDSPTPFNGVLSDPSWIPLVGQKVAELRNTAVQTIADETTQNLRSLLK
ncbi:MAG: TatD family hydrolase [Candidatus Micrarchaeota archaeon]